MEKVRFLAHTRLMHMSQSPKSPTFPTSRGTCPSRDADPSRPKTNFENLTMETPPKARGLVILFGDFLLVILDSVPLLSLIFTIRELPATAKLMREMPRRALGAEIARRRFELACYRWNFLLGNDPVVHRPGPGQAPELRSALGPAVPLL